MKYNTINPFQIEKLPWEAFIPINANKLILGTFPTQKQNRDFEFYYPNRNNRFWKVMAHLSNQKEKFKNLIEKENFGDKAIEVRKELLDNLKLAITDMGIEIYRQNDSSLDSNIFPKEFTDIFKLLEQNPAINTIILTSCSGGNSVLSWFKTYCSINKVEIKIDKKRKGIINEVYVEPLKKSIGIMLLNSTSSLSSKKLDFLEQQYDEAFKLL